MASLNIERRDPGAHPANPSAPQSAPRELRVARTGRAGGMRRAVRRASVALFSSAIVLGTLAPAALAAAALTVTTPYPSVVVAPGAHVTFNVSITTTGAQRVALSLTGAPAAWKAGIHGGGFVIDATQTNGTDAATVRIDVDVPIDATGSTNMVLKATTAAATVELPLQITVDTQAAGDVTLKTDFPSLRGPSTQTFSFNLTLANGTSEDLTFSANAQGPTGWTITANLTGQSGAASAVVKAGSSSGVTVSAVPPSGVAAGKYDIAVVAVAGERTIQGKLQVEVTGSYTFTLATSDGRLNGHGSAGAAQALSILITNTGTAAITNAQLTGSGPSGWTITFDQPTIASIAAGGNATAIAQIKPSADAIAGDYPVSISVAGDNATQQSLSIRYTVETSLVWGIVGIGLLVIVAGGIWWVFQRFGRR